MTSPKIVVIGAGAAGMMAAAEASRRGAEVTLLEKNTKTGVKILMSGGTRCNITHDTDARGIAEAFGHARRFLQPSVGAFPPRDVIAMFHQLGVETKREETGKFFPVSNRAIDVRDALHRSMIDAGTQLHMKTAVTSIDRVDQGWRVTTHDDSGDHQWIGDRVIVTAGGRSWPGCGTTGDAYGWLESLGHTLVTPRPALVPLVGGTAVTRALSGLTLPDVVAMAQVGKEKTHRRSSLLMTHFGFSGPAAMDVSGLLTTAANWHDTMFALDLLPDVSEDELRARFRGGPPKSHVTSLLSGLVPSRLSEQIAIACGMRTEATANHPASEKTLAELSKTALQHLLEHLKRWRLPIHDTRGFAKAEVTAGGVTLAEVDPRTMASRRHDGLFIAGEVLDVDGPIGGYNFQAAFATGRAAGIAASTPCTSAFPG